MALGSSSNIQRAKLRRGPVAGGQHPNGAAGAALVAQYLAEQCRHLVIGQQVMPHGRPVSPARPHRRRAPAGNDRLSREASSEHGLADALAGHGVGGHCCVADEAHPAAGQRRPVDPGGNRPGGVSILQLETGTESFHDVRSLQQVDPLLLHIANPPSAIALHAEADIGPTSGEGEAPHVTGQQVGLEPNDESLGRRPRDVAGILAERVPLAEVAGLANSQGLAGGGPHSIGGNDIPRQ